MRFFGGVCLLALALAGASANEVPGNKLNPAPTIDGIVNESEWAGAPLLEGGFDDDNGAVYPLPLRYRLGYDAKYIYIAAQVTLANPKSIRANAFRQNVSLSGDDWVFFRLDAFGRTGSYSGFGFNSRGATSISIAGGRAAKREWIGEFQAKGRRTETGWEGEARIPWGVLRLPPQGVRDIAFNISMFDPREGREFEYKYSPNGDQGFPLWKQVEVPASGNQRSLKLLPYVYGGIDPRDRHIANMGLDVKTSLNDQIDLVGTINPDFRNIENQILSLDFSYFERLTNDVRPFFQEGGQFFQTSMDSPIFNSNRIGKFDTGLKTFGKLGDNTNFGILNTLDFGNQSNTVANVRHRLGKNWTITGAHANRQDRPRNQANDASFLSTSYGDQKWSFFAQGTATRDRQAGTGHRYNIGAGFRDNVFNSFWEYIEIDQDYLPRIGFAPETNYRGIAGFVGMERFFSKGFLRESNSYFNYWDYDRMSGESYRRGVSLFQQLNLRSDIRIGMGASVSTFEQFHDRSFDINVGFPAEDPFRNINIGASWARFQDTPYRNFGIGWNARPYFNLQTSVSLQEVDFGGDKSIQVIGSANYDLDEFWSIATRAVRRDRDYNIYLSLRRAGNRGAEYFLIIGDPNARSFQRQLIVKAVIPFELKF